MRRRREPDKPEAVPDTLNPLHEVVAQFPQPAQLGPTWEFSAIELANDEDGLLLNLAEAQTVAHGWEPVQVFEAADSMWLLVRRRVAA